MNGTRFLLAMVAGMLIGVAAISSCDQTIQIGCSNPDNSIVLSCGITDPCNCYADAGVDVGEINRGSCSLPNPCADAGDAGADGPTADASTDADIPSCTGQCLPTPPAGWSGPFLLAVGDAGMPSCPAIAPSIAYEGSGDLTWAPATCAACACEPSAGACILPATMTASVASCADAGPDSLSRSFGPSGGWDGGCSTENAVPGPCPAQSAACIRSVTIAPLTMGERCAPAPEAAPIVPPFTWGAFALACTSGAAGTCEEAGDTCAPGSADGFQPCVFQEGAASCPGFSPYTQPFVFYQGVADTRDCAACTCGPVQGSSCSALISIYSDSACSDLVAADTITASATGPCLDVPPGSALGSVLADAGPYVSGTCQQSDAGPTGSAEGSMPATFCCLPM